MVNPCGVDSCMHGRCETDTADLSFCVCDSGYRSVGLSCVEIETDLCFNVTCNSWQSCNHTNGKCENKPGHCDDRDNCEKDGLCENHLCVYPCNGIDCGVSGKCVLDEDDQVSCDCDVGYYANGLSCVEDLCYDHDAKQQKVCVGNVLCNRVNGLCECSPNQMIYADGNCYNWSSHESHFLKSFGSEPLEWQGDDLLWSTEGNSEILFTRFDSQGNKYLITRIIYCSTWLCFSGGDDTVHTIILTKYDPSGEEIWHLFIAQDEDSIDYHNVWGMEINDYGVYIVVLERYKRYLMHYSESGQLLQRTLLSTEGFSEYDAFSFFKKDHNGYLFLGGSEQRDEDPQNQYLLAKFDPQGAFLWRKVWGKSGDDALHDCIEHDDSLYLIGSGLTPNDDRDIYLSRVKITDGSILWSTYAGSSSDDDGYCITVWNEKLYITGRSFGEMGDLVQLESESNAFYGYFEFGGGEPALFRYSEGARNHLITRGDHLYLAGANNHDVVVVEEFKKDDIFPEKLNYNKEGKFNDFVRDPTGKLILSGYQIIDNYHQLWQVTLAPGVE